MKCSHTPATLANPIPPPLLGEMQEPSGERQLCREVLCERKAGAVEYLHGVAWESALLKRVGLGRVH